MNAEYFDTLEQQLVLASERLSNEHVERRHRRWVGRRPLVVALVAMMCASTAFAVSDQAPWSPPELTLRANPEDVPPLIGAPVPTSLTSFLGVLRTPQSEADRGAVTRDALKFFNSGTPGGIRSNGIRSIVFPDSKAPSLVVVPYDEQTAAGPETKLAVWVTDPTGAAGGTVRATLDSLRRPMVTGSSGEYVFGFAPDGVTHVRLTWPDQAPIEVPVTRNAFMARAATNPPLFPTVTWLDADGKTVPALD